MSNLRTATIAAITAAVVAAPVGGAWVRSDRAIGALSDAVARTAHLDTCTTVFYEDGSQRHIDPEEMTRACSRWVGSYVGSGQARADRRLIARLAP